MAARVRCLVTSGRRDVQQLAQTQGHVVGGGGKKCVTMRTWNLNTATNFPFARSPWSSSLHSPPTHSNLLQLSCEQQQQQKKLTVVRLFTATSEHVRPFAGNAINPITNAATFLGNGGHPCVCAPQGDTRDLIDSPGHAQGTTHIKMSPDDKAAALSPAVVAGQLQKCNDRKDG